MDAHVIFEIDHAAEFLAAHVADRLLPALLPGVDPHVVLQRAGVAAALAAGLADVRPLSRVGQHVVLQSALVATTFTANLAGEKLFPGVFAHVISEDARVAGAEAENVAAVFFLRVSHPVSGQGRGREETLAAHFADEIFFPGMQVLVISQTLSALEGLRAKRADERLLQGAAPVPLKWQQPGELVLTQLAHVSDRFLQAVLVHVSFECRLVSKLCPTVRAFVKLLSSVTPRMCGEPPQPGETFATLGAKVRFGVSQVVSVHQTLQSKGFVTRRTFEWPCGLLLFNLGCGAKSVCIILDDVFLTYIRGQLWGSRVSLMCGCIS